MYPFSDKKKSVVLEGGPKIMDAGYKTFTEN